MSSDEDYQPRSTLTPCDYLRRSKRLTRNDVQKLSPEISVKTDRKGGKVSTATKTMKNKKLPKITKKKFANARKKGESREIFSGEALYPDELHQLYLKFTRDGHFRIDSSESSTLPRQSDVPKQSDGRRATKKNNNVDATAAATSKSASTEDEIGERAVSCETEDPLSVTLANPLPNGSGGTWHINTNKGQFIPPYPSFDNNKAWNHPMVNQNFMSSGRFRLGKVIDLSSDVISLIPQITTPAKQHQFATKSSANRRIIDEQNYGVPWKSLNGENLPSIARTNLENIENSYSHYMKLASAQAHQSGNVFVNSHHQTGNSTLPFQSRPINMGNAACPTDNHGACGNFTNYWNDMCLGASNTINETPIDPQNSMNYVSSSIVGYNTEMKNSDNNCAYNLEGNGGNSTIVFQNSYASSGEFSYPNNTYNYQNNNSSGPPPIPAASVNDPCSLPNSTNYWSHNNSSNRGLFMTNGCKTSCSLIATSNSTNATTTTTTTMTIVNETSPEIARINSAETIDRTSFVLDDFADSRDDDFCPTVSSICSYDDDIGYGDYMNDNQACNGNSVMKTSRIPNRGSSNDLSRKIKAEARPSYDSSINY